MPEHGGSGSGYSKGCRCLPCSVANSDRLRRRRKERLDARIMVEGRWFQPDEKVVDKHGTRAVYVNWGCRCLPCTEANSAETNRVREKAS